METVLVTARDEPTLPQELREALKKFYYQMESMDMSDESLYGLFREEWLRLRAQIDGSHGVTTP